MAEALSTVLAEEQDNRSAIRILSAVVDTATDAAAASGLQTTTRIGAVIIKETMSLILAVLQGKLDPADLRLDMDLEPRDGRPAPRGFSLPPEVTATIVKESLGLLVAVIAGGFRPENINLSETFVTSTTDKLADLGITEADIQRILQG